MRSVPMWILIALVVGLVALRICHAPPSIMQVQMPSESAPTVDVAERIEPSLAWADEQSQAAIDRQISHLRQFFVEARGRTPKFAEQVLGWGSKWRFVVDKVPYTKGNRHATFLRQVFAEQLFSEAELTQALELVAQGYGDTVGDIENRMLVRIRQDVAGLPISRLPQFADAAALESAYRDALGAALAKVGVDVRNDVASLVLSFIAQEVVTQAAIRMGVSAGILGAGAGSSWATFGVGLVVGLIVDQLVSWIWDWWADPRGSLAVEMNRKLDELEQLIINGDGTSPGMQARLEQFSRQRAAVRREAILSLVNGAVR